MTDKEKTHYLVVEKVTEHEDGSATYTFDMSDDTRGMFIEDGVKLMLMCAAAEISVEDAFDMIESIVKERIVEDAK
jgi:hypothetical protein